MKIVKASYSIEAIMPADVMAHLERCGRTCYRSEGKIDDGKRVLVCALCNGSGGLGPEPGLILYPCSRCDGSGKVRLQEEPSSHKLLRSILKRGHESVIEHASATVRFVVNRGVTHEDVRHRLCSFSQESTRYVRYDGEEEGHELTFIDPCYWLEGSALHAEFLEDCRICEERYLRKLAMGAKPEEARGGLTHDLASQIVWTANLREWRHILKLRTSPRAHPQMREVMVPLLAELQSRVPVIFEDIKVEN